MAAEVEPYGRSTEKPPAVKEVHVVGLIRANWRGLSGVEEVWQRIDEFFIALRQRSTPRLDSVTT